MLECAQPPERLEYPDRVRAPSVASIHTAPRWQDALEGVLEDLANGAVPPGGLSLLFVDSRFSDGYGDILSRCADLVGTSRIVGCSGQAVIGPGREAEREPGIAVLSIPLTGAELHPEVVPRGGSAASLPMLSSNAVKAAIVFADPFSVHTEQLIAQIEARRPDLTLIGGMASSHSGAAGTALFLDDSVYEDGAVIIGLSGDVDVRTVVAQGAEPIGRPWTVTDCELNVVRTIGNRPALDVLRATLEELDPEVADRARRNLLVGLAIDEYRHPLGRGDYLIRNVLGFDQDSGAIAISANARLGQTLQFQFRDAEAADQDLREQLAAVPGSLEPGERMLGALLCTCNGRGEGLFGTADHDALAISRELDALPVAGLFCNGEIGPVGGTAFLHGFTASVGLFTTKVPARPVAASN